MAKNSRARGRSQVIAGNVKQGFGKLIGNQQLEAEGAAEVIEGEANEAAAKLSERVGGAAQELSGTLKQVAGDLIASPGLAAEGHTEINAGKQRQKANQ